MLNLKIIFTGVLSALADCSELNEANYYNDGFASIKTEKDGKLYVISMRCEDIKDGNS